VRYGWRSLGAWTAIGSRLTDLASRRVCRDRRRRPAGGSALRRRDRLAPGEWERT
jgi:hypothetical protein